MYGGTTKMADFFIWRTTFSPLRQVLLLSITMTGLLADPRCSKQGVCVFLSVSPLAPTSPHVHRTVQYRAVNVDTRGKTMPAFTGVKAGLRLRWVFSAFGSSLCHLNTDGSTLVTDSGGRHVAFIEPASCSLSRDQVGVNSQHVFVPSRMHTGRARRPYHKNNGRTSIFI